MIGENKPFGVAPHPQKTKRTYSELLRLAAETWDMCQLYGIDFNRCVKLDGIKFGRAIKVAFDDVPDKYEFAIGIVERKPVFEGDLLYTKEHNNSVYAKKEMHFYDKFYTWEKNKPVKKTFSLNGVYLPSPMSFDNSNNDFYFVFSGIRFSFESIYDMEEVRTAIRIMLVDAVNKAE
jgi:hypothetical protein